MKTNYIFWFGAALLLLIVISSFGCNRVVGYSSPNTYAMYEGFEKNSGEGEAFGPMEYAEYGEPAESNDQFSDTPGKITCSKNSSGLSNSNGYLCLSKEQQILLQTRGGNSSTGEAQIGN
jgi:hypothetical protein